MGISRASGMQEADANVRIEEVKKAFIENMLQNIFSLFPVLK